MKKIDITGRFPNVMQTLPLLSALIILLSFATGCFLVTVEPETEEPGAAASAPAPQPEPEPAQPSPAEAARRNAEEERRRTHLNVIRFAVDLTPEPRIRITERKHPSTISKYGEQQEINGSYYVTKQGVLLCDSGPCAYEWTVRFTYTDEAGRPDAFLLQCHATVFGGMTPSGTRRSKLDWCINGDCEYFKDLCHDGAKGQLTRGRYTFSATKTAFTVHRADIAREILDAGRKLKDY